MPPRHSQPFQQFSGELDPEKLTIKILMLLLELQNVERGSLWVRRGDVYECIEALGQQSEAIKGVRLPVSRPSVVGWVIENGRMTIAEAGQDARHFKEIEDQLSVKSSLILCFPLFLRDGSVYGAVQIIDTASQGKRLNLDSGYLQMLQNLVDVASLALSNSLDYTVQIKENQKLKATLDNIRFDSIVVGSSPSFQRVMEKIKSYSRTDYPVLITGESGTGKELAAREIHRLSARADKPFLVQNVNAIPDTLLESELFGYKKGAFTGADRDAVGLFEAADGGTVFLDEIGDMPFPLQAKLLRVLQDKEIKPLGGTKTKKIDFRIIAATNVDLKREIEAKRFREDLFYRLNVLPLILPPLRERPEDVPILVHHFLQKEARRMAAAPKKFSRPAMALLARHVFPGNVRELENIVKRLMALAEGETIEPADLPPDVLRADELAPREEVMAEAALEGEDSEAREEALRIAAAACPPTAVFSGKTWDDVERAYVLHLLEKNRWNVTRAAQEADVNRSTFDSRMKKLGIRKRD